VPSPRRPPHTILIRASMPLFRALEGLDCAVKPGQDESRALSSTAKNFPRTQARVFSSATVAIEVVYGKSVAILGLLRIAHRRYL
jgi:hypothetical protein